MLLETYKNDNLMWLTNVNGPISMSGSDEKEAFRGDLVIEFGDMHEASQTRNPPKQIFEQVVLLADGGKIIFLAGFLEDLNSLAPLTERFKGDFAEDLMPILYVLNIDDAMQVAVDGVTFACLPLAEGLVWNELMDLLYIEKSDLKGQSAEEKVETVADAKGEFKPKGEDLDFATAVTKTNKAVREYAGAI